MLSVLTLGLKSLDRVAAAAEKRLRLTSAAHPLAAYPRLASMLHEAERSGTLAAERRRLISKRLAA